MEQVSVGEIYSIEIGEPNEVVKWTVGFPAAKTSPMDKYKITKIVRDDTNYYLFGFVRYLIMVENDKKESKVFREYNDRHKITLTYNVKD